MDNQFTAWIPLARLSLSDMPRCGQCCVVYAFREASTKDVLKYGETDCLRRRMFRNYIGGSGGSTTERIHEELFERNRFLEVEVAWVETKNKTEAQLKESRFRAEYKREKGRLPIWDRRN